ncbi:MAG: MFS transporter [Chloroflexota bacterium]
MSTAVKKDLVQRDHRQAIQLANFYHLYWDVAWFGILFGSTLSFLPVFAARLGASGWQIGLLTAGPALVNIIFTLPAGRWLESQALGPAVTQSAIAHRLGYLLLSPLPLLLPASLQVWAVLGLIFLMAVPGTALAVGFNGLLATAVPIDKRGHVVGWRNSLLAGATVLSFLFSGWLLDRLTFELGYVLVFGLGALGAVMSTYHLYRIRIDMPPAFKGRPTQDLAQPGRLAGFSGGLPARLTVGLRLLLTRRFAPDKVRPPISTRYRRVMLAFFLFHFSQLLPAALLPLFWVHELRLSDGAIGGINAMFFLVMLLVSPLLAPLTRRFGNYRLTAGSALLLSLYPLLTALSIDLKLIIVANLVGGSVWAILSGSLINRLLELIPPDDRPAHLAIYNLILNVATMAGTMLGPALSHWLGIRQALLLIFVLRLIGGLALARWG